MTTEIEERAHALFSPSSAYTWIECKASIAAQLGQPDDSSEYADDGTASHDVMRWCLDNGTDAAAYAGRIITINGREFEVDEERIEYVQMYVDGVRDRIAAYELTGATVTMFVEQRLSIEHITGEKGAKGTSDTVLIAVWPDGHAEICVIDLKYGRGVEVIAENNYQAMIYAEAARNEHADFYDFTNIRIAIHQPRVNPTANEWEILPADLAVWIDAVATPAAERARWLLKNVEERPREFKLQPADFKPGEKQCRFCKARPVCPELAKHVEETIGADFEAIASVASVDTNEPIEVFTAKNVDLLDNARLGLVYESLDLIDSWMKAVRGRIEYELLQGNVVPGTKLVQGRRGARKWESQDDAQATLKSMRLKVEEMYNLKLISPTQAEALLKKESPRRWKKLEALITQPDGKPSVAAESDKRPAIVIQPVVDDFEAVSEAVSEAVTAEGDDLL